MRAALFLTLLVCSGVAVFFVGCGDECSQVDDCDIGEMCVSGTCTRFTSTGCFTDDDCQVDGGEMTRLRCLAGVCRFAVVTPPGTGTSTTPDAGDLGQRDTGTSTTTDAGDV